jgi:hypothetical protein
MTIFALVQHHKYSINELEEIFPFERDIYESLLLDYLEKRKQELENQ